LNKVPGFSWTRDDFRRQLKKSTFAPGARFLSFASQRDLEVFYAFCRAVDDSADDYGPAKGRRYLAAWKKALARRPGPGAPLLVVEVWRLCGERGIPMALLRELIKGAESDLRPKVSFKTRGELLLYCHRVAGVVGQACLPIFGVPLEKGAAYAESLGLAFQLINIVRDAKEDAHHGRCYFAQDDLKRLGSEQAVAALYAKLALDALALSDALAATLPSRPLRPSRLMRALYGELLRTMLADGLRVREKRYRLGNFKKAWIILKSLAS
jgi:phytoene synthase